MSVSLSMMNAANLKQKIAEENKLKDHLLNLEKGCLLLHPDNSFKVKWDIFIMLILLFSCIITPLRLAFDDDESQAWTIALYTIDILFFLDIVIIFNTIIHDEKYQLVF